MGRTEDEIFAVFDLEAAPPRVPQRRHSTKRCSRTRQLTLLLVLAVVAAIALALLRAEPDREQRHALRWTGCTLAPQGCSRQPLMTFDLKVLGLGLLPFTRIGELSRAPYLPADGFTSYATNLSSLLPGKPRVQLALAVRQRVDKATIWDVTSRSASSSSYRHRSVDLGDGVSARVSKASLAEGFTETWVVASGAGHGAVGMTIAVDGQGAGTSLSGWTDGNVTSVLRQYLGVALPTTQTPPSTDELRTVPQGCTLAPSTCSPSIADGFTRGQLGAIAMAARVTDEEEPDPYRYVATSPAPSAQSRTRLSITISSGDAPQALLDTARGGRPEWVQREVRLRSGEVVLVSRDYASGTQSFHEVWVLRPASGEVNHGSIAIEIEHTQGRSSARQVSAPPGWSDANVLALMRLYLGITN